MFHKVALRASLPTRSVQRFCTGAAKVIETEAMEKTINQVTLLGRVGQEPQKRGTAAHPLIVFSLATHMNYKYENGEYMQRTEWHRICVFKPNLRDVVYQHLKKGQRILVNGRINYSEVKDESGGTKSSTSIIADDIIFFQGT